MILPRATKRNYPTRFVALFYKESFSKKIHEDF